MKNTMSNISILDNEETKSILYGVELNNTINNIVNDVQNNKLDLEETLEQHLVKFFKVYTDKIDLLERKIKEVVILVIITKQKLNETKSIFNESTDTFKMLDSSYKNVSKLFNLTTKTIDTNKIQDWIDEVENKSSVLKSIDDIL
jgi:hypothetical protein